MSLHLYKNKSTVNNNSKCIKMTITNKLKRSWKNDIWQSVEEYDVLKLRNQGKIIKSSPELKMSDYRLNTQLREIYLY
jgi:hypothetical protein